MTIDEHTVIPFAPDWSYAIKHARRHRTGLAEGVTGMEERAAFFTKSKRRINYTIAVDNSAEAFTVESILRQAQESAKAAVPLWGREQVVASLNGNAIVLETPSALFEAGEWIGVASPFGDIADAVKIQSANGQNVYLDNSVNAAPGDLLVPLVLGRITSVPGEVISGGGRAFEIRFKSVPPLETINAQFIFNEVDTESNWLSFLANLYFLFYIDTSGSMDADVPNITAAAQNLKVLLRDVIYGGDQAKADHFVRIENWSSERWLERLAENVFNEEASRYVSLAFINEARSSYHSVPRNAANEPTSSFNTDYGRFQTEFARREYSRCKVYSVDPTAASWEDDNIEFNAHLADAVNGQGGYASLGTALIDQFVFYETAIPSGRTAEEYLVDIFDMLGLR